MAGAVRRPFVMCSCEKVLRLQANVESRQFLECIFLLKHFQASCLNINGRDDADVAMILDFSVTGLIAFASKSIPSVFSPLGAQLVFTACSCSTINRSIPLKDFSNVLHAAIAVKDISESDMEFAASTFNSVFECFGKTFSVDVETYSASVVLFLKRCSDFFSDRDRSAPGQDFSPHVQKLIDLISPVLSQNPKLLG